MEINFLENLREFLSFLIKKRKFPKERTLDKLKTKFGKKNFDDLDNFCFKEGLIGSEEIIKKNTRDISRKIKLDGLKFLEESQREKEKENNSKRIIKANWALVFATIGLLIVTGVYAFLVYQSNQTLSSQFEAENRPYLTLENLSFENSLNELPGYIIKIKNRGNSPAKILSIKMRDNPSRDYLEKKDENIDIWLFQGEELTVDWRRFLNLYGGFEDETNIPNFARVIIYYEWNNQKYPTSRDFYNHLYDRGKNIINISKGEQIIFEKGTQLLDKEPPLNQALWSMSYNIK